MDASEAVHDADVVGVGEDVDVVDIVAEQLDDASAAVVALGSYHKVSLACQLAS